MAYSKNGYTKSGEENRGDSAQDMYSKNTTFEGNMGRNMTNQGYEPTHTVDKKTGDIPGAGIC